MHGGGPMMYRRKWGGAMRKYPEPFVDSYVEKKPTSGLDWIRNGLRERFARNPQGGTGRPVPNVEPKPEKTEIELYLERIGHVRR